MEFKLNDDDTIFWNDSTEDCEVHHTEINFKETDDEDSYEGWFSDNYNKEKVQEVFEDIGDCKTGDLVVVGHQERNFGMYVVIIDANGKKAMTKLSTDMYSASCFADYGVLWPVKSYVNDMSTGYYIRNQPVMVKYFLSLPKYAETRKKTKNFEKLKKLENWYIYLDSSGDFIDECEDIEFVYGVKVYKDNKLRVHVIDLRIMESGTDDTIVLCCTPDT